MRIPATIAIRAVAAVSLIGWAAPAAGQLEALAHTTPTERAAVQTAFMRRKLDLTPEQLPKIDAINVEYAQKMQGVIDGDQGPLVRMRSAKAIDSSKDTALQKVLSPDQFQKYLAAKVELRKEIEAKAAAKAGAAAP